MANVKSNDRLRTALEQHLCKTTSTCSHIEGSTARDIDIKTVKTSYQLMCSTRNVVVCSIHADVVIVFNFEGRFIDDLAANSNEAFRDQCGGMTARASQRSGCEGGIEALTSHEKGCRHLRAVLGGRRRALHSLLHGFRAVGPQRRTAQRRVRRLTE